MKNKYLSAAQKLHKFVSDDTDLSDADVRECLKGEGVNVQQFLARLGRVSGRAAKPPTTSERLRALASRAGSRVKRLLGDDSTAAQIPSAAVAYGRKGKPDGRGKKNSPPSKRTKQ